MRASRSLPRALPSRLQLVLTARPKHELNDARLHSAKEERAVGARDSRRTTRVAWNSRAPVALQPFHRRSERSRCVTSSPCAPELHRRFFEGVGDRVLETQCAAFARGGNPRVGPAPCAGGFEERRFEPNVVAVCVSGADECRGAPVVAVHHGDGGQATEAFKRLGPNDRFAAEREFLAERVRSGIDEDARVEYWTEVRGLAGTSRVGDQLGHDLHSGRSRPGRRSRRSSARAPRRRGPPMTTPARSYSGESIPPPGLLQPTALVQLEGSRRDFAERPIPGAAITPTWRNRAITLGAQADEVAQARGYHRWAATTPVCSDRS